MRDHEGGNVANAQRTSDEGQESAPSVGGRGKRTVVIAAVSVPALVVGLLIGWAVGRTSDDDSSVAESAEGAEGDHADHDDAMDDDDQGLATLLADHHYRPPVDDPLDSETRQLLTFQLSVVNQLIADYSTIADAEADDWRRAGPFIPGLGTHYIPRDRDYTFTIPSTVGDDEEGEEVRPLLIYEGLEDDAPLSGFMFMALADEAPVGFAGPYDTWHQHSNICVVIDDEGDIELPFVADLDNITDEMCEDRGGSMTEVSAHMVHVWSVPGYDSELGLFSEVNPRITCPDSTYNRVPYDQLAEPYDTACRS